MGREHRASVSKVFDLISIIWKYIQAVIKKQSKNKQNPLSASKRYHKNMYFAKMNLQPLQIKISQCSECPQHISLKTNLLPITANMQDIYRIFMYLPVLFCFHRHVLFFHFIFAASLSFASVKKRISSWIEVDAFEGWWQQIFVLVLTSSEKGRQSGRQIRPSNSSNAFF